MNSQYDETSGLSAAFPCEETWLMSPILSSSIAQNFCIKLVINKNDISKKMADRILIKGGELKIKRTYDH